MTDKQQAVQIFHAAVAAVQPAQLLEEHIRISEDALVIGGESFAKDSIHHIYLIGAGKAAAAMAVATERILGDYISDGLVTTKYHHALPSEKIKILEGAHPVPDENCVQAVVQTVQLLQQATANDLVICLISGGASALWCDVPPGATLMEVQTTFDQLMKSGAAIHEVNTVRKHLSMIKGGQLLKHCGGATVFSFIISDVPGDRLDVIASGPTVADASTFDEAHAILVKYNLLPTLPLSIRQHIENGIEGKITETPKPGDSVFDNAINKIIGNNHIAMLAAAKEAKARGYHVQIAASLITGDAEEEAKNLVAMANQYKGKKPACIIQGGETTVNVTGTGKGGRNQHFVLTALDEMHKLQQQNALNEITILSGGTDGTDGPTDAAGAVVNKETLTQVLRRGLSIEAYLKNHDAYHFLKKTDSLLMTGPTQTNVMDIMVAIIK